ncbi:MAG TPA: 50S ribosomal protein L25 [Chloroflexota bacterium]|jgi:large subunit ribosomal protein L25|nr:50S ribosomal protein L25 [Chloroflexota bacterium]
MPTTSKKLELSADPREVFGKHVRRLRRQGIVPANIYGHGDPRPIQAPARALEVLLAHGGRTGLVSIAVSGGTAAETALLKDIQRDPRSGQILHVEFQAVSMSESVTSTVPIRFVGDSSAVSRFNGILTHPRTEVRVTARASDLPDVIEVDLSTLAELGSAIHVKDLPESATYKVVDAPDDVLAMVEAPKETEAVEPGAEAPAAEAAETPAAGTGEAESQAPVAAADSA